MFWPKGKHLIYSLTSFPNLSNIFLSFLHITSYVTWTISSFNCMHPLMCVHKSIHPMSIHLLRCAHGDEHTKTHDVICDTFVAIAWDVGFHMLLPLHFFFNHIQLLWLMNQHCAYQRWHSHLSQHCHCWPNTSGFTSLILQNSRICCIRCNSSQGKELSQLTPHCSIPPFSNWGIWFLTQTCQCVFTHMCQCQLEFERDRRPSSFYLRHFSSSKSFDHIIKDVSVFHLKLSDSHRFSNFLTFIPSRHTSHHHGRPIASCRFLTCKYYRLSTVSYVHT
jgi:hypothetical protein